jgi:hypothetical protein
LPTKERIRDHKAGYNEEYLDPKFPILGDAQEEAWIQDIKEMEKRYAQRSHAPQEV